MICDSTVYDSILNGWDLIIPATETDVKEVVAAAKELNRSVSYINIALPIDLQNSILTSIHANVVVFDGLEYADEDATEIIREFMKNRYFKGEYFPELDNVVLIAGGISYAYNALKDESTTRIHVDF